MAHYFKRRVQQTYSVHIYLIAIDTVSINFNVIKAKIRRKIVKFMQIIQDGNI